MTAINASILVLFATHLLQMLGGYILLLVKATVIANVWKIGRRPSSRPNNPTKWGPDTMHPLDDYTIAILLFKWLILYGIYVYYREDE